MTRALRFALFGGLIWWGHQTWALNCVLWMLVFAYEALLYEYHATLTALEGVQDELQQAIEAHAMLTAEKMLTDSARKPNCYVFHTSTYGKVN